MSDKSAYRLVRSETLYKGRLLELVKDSFLLPIAKDKIVTRVTLRHPGAVVVLPFLDNDHILLIRQFRYAAKGELWEIPAGTLEKGERPLACAKRELEEETGHKAGRWSFLTDFLPAPGVSDERMWLYAATRLTPGRKNTDHDEWIEHEAVPLKKALAMVRRGAIRDGKTIIGVLWALQFKDSLWKKI